MIISDLESSLLSISALVNFITFVRPSLVLMVIEKSETLGKVSNSSLNSSLIALPVPSITADCKTGSTLSTQ